MVGRSILLRFTGDLILDEPHPERYFAPARDQLRAADVLVGQVEVPHTDRGYEESTDVPAPPANPEHLRALADVGVDIATLAGNHIGDRGAEGVLDTVAHLRALGIATTGAGANLDEACEPAVVERGGVQIGVLDYNCVGPRISWATSRKAGGAYVEIITHYEGSYGGPGGPPASIHTFPEPAGFARMLEQVRALRERVDVLCVVLHKGLGHVPAKVIDYERTLAHAAIDAGADAVVGHHAHILRGIELYRGRPIFHGLGNFVTVTRALSAGAENTAERRAWALRRRELSGFEPDPAMPLYPFHPESRNTMLAHYRWREDGAPEIGFVPCWIDDEARPCPLDEQRGRGVVDYVADISRRAGFETSFGWRDGIVVAS